SRQVRKWPSATVALLSVRAPYHRLTCERVLRGRVVICVFTKLYTREKPPKRPSPRLAAWPSRHASLKGDFHERSNINPPHNCVRRRAAGSLENRGCPCTWPRPRGHRRFRHYLVQSRLRTTLRLWFLARARLLARWALRRRVRSGPRRGAGRSDDPTYFG